MLETEIIEITTEYIKLAALLKFSGVCENGADAGEVIHSGLVEVNGKQNLQKGAKIYPGDRVKIGDIVLEVASVEG